MLVLELTRRDEEVNKALWSLWENPCDECGTSKAAVQIGNYSSHTLLCWDCAAADEAKAVEDIAEMEKPENADLYQDVDIEECRAALESLRALLAARND